MSELNDFLKQCVKEQEAELIALRRKLHTGAELSGQEYETSRFLKQQMTALGLELHEVKGTGFFAVLDTGRPGKTLGMRTDIDALPVTESEHNLKGPRSCRSAREGVMHACGHDGHMAMLLTAARILTAHKDKLSGKVVFIFEEGEETGSGIHAMIDALRPIPFDAMYGCHLASFIDTGRVAVDPGPVMCGTIGLDMTVKGRSGHGSRPDLAVSPIFGAANIITSLASAWVNRIDVNEQVTLGLGSIHGGNVPNTIPGEVRITGTMRFFNEDMVPKALEIVRCVSENVARAHLCEVEFNEWHRQHGGPVVNDPELAERAAGWLEELYPGALQRGVKWFGSESFRDYCELAPGIFPFIGMRNPEAGSGAEHHNELFDIDESALAVGCLLECKFAFEMLKKG